MAAVLARAYRDGDLPATDALRIIRHEMRRRNTNTTLRVRPRSVDAQAVIDRYTEEGRSVPKNGTPDALHADHTHPVTVEHLETLNGVQDWLAALPLLREVVCVSARENYRLEALERAGVTGPDKYLKAGIKWAPA